MTGIRLVVPNEGEICLDQLKSRITAARSYTTAPFSPKTMDLASAFSTRLFHSPESKRYPELQALAFFMRRTKLNELRGEFAARVDHRVVRSPRGVVFHIPPRNVSSILVYSWLMAALTGNASVVRLPRPASPESSALVAVWNEVIASSQPDQFAYVIEYDRDEEVTAELSRLADVRIIWGGDETVNELRRFPLPPTSTEIVFANKYSLAVFATERYLSASHSDRSRLVERFYNDTFWFDQQACSSPRLLVWIGEQAHSTAASEEFLSMLKDCFHRKGYVAGTATALNKQAFSYAAVLDQGVTGYRSIGNELTILDVPDLGKITRDHCGGGLLFQCFLPDWNQVVEFVCRQDQTVAHYGFEDSELRTVACRLNGRGVDRFVPVGQALDFNHIWDGYDLLNELTRAVHIGSAK